MPPSCRGASCQGACPKGAPPLVKEGPLEDIEARVRQLESDSQQLKAEVSSLDQRVGKHGQELDEMRVKNAANEAILSRIDRTVTKIDEKMEAQEAKPGKRWEELTSQIIALAVAALAGIVLARIGLQ